MDKNKKTIIDVWELGCKYNRKEMKKIKEEFNVEVVELDEYYGIYRFKDTKIEFTIGWDENYEDYDLTGDTLKFAKKVVALNEDTGDKIRNELQDLGFDEVYCEDNSVEYSKDELRYYSQVYPKEEKDIRVRKEDG